MPMSIEQLFDIDSILVKKGWDGDILNVDGEIARDITFKLFDMLETEDEYVLLKYLLENYFFCTDYSSYCYKLAKHIEETFYDERLIVIPVSDKEGYIKSGHAVAYDLSRYLNMEIFREAHFLESLQSISDNISNYTIVVIDDFVGSGSQFRRFVNRSIGQYGLDPQNVYLYSIVMMERARSRITSHCAAHFATVEFHRAISGNSDIQTVDDAVAVYSAIERRINVGKNYRRGYLKTESIVSMRKTPNNTLPIFWVKGGANGAAWPAIFPRR